MTSGAASSRIDQNGEGWEEGGEEDRLQACRLALDRLLDLRGDRCLEEIEDEVGQGRRAEAVDFSRFRFGRDRLALLPSRPGIYRFIGEGDRLLYVGKSRDLARRVSGYFRPLEAGHVRRARLLGETLDLEWETTPSELEALILEGKTIRRERPPHNQQFEIHPAGEKVGARENNVALVLCEGDPDEVSVFLLREGKARWLARVPRTPGETLEERAGVVAAAWLTGKIEPSSGLEPLDDDGALLVLRYLRLHRDRVDRLYADECPGIKEAAAGLVRLAVRERPAWEPWTVRSPSHDIS